MSSDKTYLITGVNRGIGKGFVTLLLQRPSTTIIAGVRDPSSPASQAIASLPAAEGSKVILVKIDSSSESDAAAAIEKVQKDHAITSIDVVIANAGISHTSGPVSKVSTEAAVDHFKINSIAPLILFAAAAPLLKASNKNPIFVAISSVIGSNGSQDVLKGLPLIFSPYGASKAALNWFVRRLHYEEEWLTSFVVHPGLVETDMSAAMTASPGVDAKNLGAITVSQSVQGIVGVIDGATKEISGTFKSYDGADLPW